MSDWKPTEDIDQSPFNQMLDQWVRDGMPTQNGRDGWLGLVTMIIMALIVLALLWAFVYYGIPYVLHIPPVSTPDRIWVR